MGVSRLLFSGSVVAIGEFRCRAEDSLWSRENVASAYLFVFPRVPVLIEQANREPVVADANRVMFYNAGRPYRRARISSEGDACEFFAVDPVVAAEAARDAGLAAEPGGEVFPFAAGPGCSSAYLAQRLIYEHTRRAPAPDPLHVEEAALSVLRVVLYDAAAAVVAHAPRSRERTRAEQASCVEIVRSMVGADLARPLTLKQIAQAAGLSPYHLCRVFRAHAGVPITRYRDRLRLRASLDRVPDEDLCTLARGLGYSTHAHFTARFRREFGITPSEFRRRATKALARDLAGPLDRAIA